MYFQITLQIRGRILELLLLMIIVGGRILGRGGGAKAFFLSPFSLVGPRKVLLDVLFNFLNNPRRLGTIIMRKFRPREVEEFS